jgi:hypothetical protein
VLAAVLQASTCPPAGTSLHTLIQHAASHQPLWVVSDSTAAPCLMAQIPSPTHGAGAGAACGACPTAHTFARCGPGPSSNQAPSAGCCMLCTTPELSWWGCTNKHKNGHTHTLFLGLVPTIPGHPPNKYLAYLRFVRQLLGANAPPIYTACQVLSVINCQGSSALVSRPPPHGWQSPQGWFAACLPAE